MYTPVSLCPDDMVLSSKNSGSLFYSYGLHYKESLIQGFRLYHGIKTVSCSLVLCKEDTCIYMGACNVITSGSKYTYIVGIV